MSANKLLFEIPGGVDSSKFVALHCIGLLTCARSNGFENSGVERFFLPRTVRLLEKAEVASEIVNLVSLGCELEDVDSLAPHRLQDALESLLLGFLKYLSSFSTLNFNEFISVSKT